MKIVLPVVAFSLFACTSSSGSSSGSTSDTTSSSGGTSTGSDAGSCDIAPLPDGGPCTDDSQCPTGDYCDLMPTLCPDGGGISTVAGICLPTAGTGCSSCHIAEDCGHSSFCLEVTPEPGAICTVAFPCENGTCNVPEPPTCSGPGGLCPPGCKQLFLPHVCFGNTYPCVCPGNSCTPPPADAG